MKKKFDQVYQFKISLRDIKPPIWRRIQVPETYSFWDLHVAIQDSMGWSDCHLHQFEMFSPSIGMNIKIGILDEEGYDMDIHPGWKLKIADHFSMEDKSAAYTYDFGDNWEHKIQLEKILPREKNTNYPVCIGGKRAGPPEDCGGVSGYENLLETINDPDNEEYEETIEWLGGEFDPEHFDPGEVHFDDPAKRRRMAFG